MELSCGPAFARWFSPETVLCVCGAGGQLDAMNVFVGLELCAATAVGSNTVCGNNLPSSVSSIAPRLSFSLFNETFDFSSTCPDQPSSPTGGPVSDQ